MPSIIAPLPASVSRYRIEDARVATCLTEAPDLTPDQDGLAPASLLIDGDRIAAVQPAGARSRQDGTPAISLDGGIVLPCFVDAHVHLDKGHIWPRRRNPDGSFAGAIGACKEDRPNWSAGDVRARMQFGLRAAYAYGTAAMRTHIDSLDAQTRVSWPVLAELRQEWRGRVELSASPLFSVDRATDFTHMRDIAWAMRECGAGLGAVTYMIPELRDGLDRLFRLASDNGVDLDFHVDETHDPRARSLEAIADMAMAHRFEGRILAGHCCSLALQDEEDRKRVIDKVARAGIAIVALPMCNMFLQDRDVAARRTPRWRGVTALHELKAAGVAVMVASDNTRDPFYAYGDLDMLEVFREATRILHLDHPASDWLRTVTATPAEVLRFDSLGMLRTGGPADLVAFRARSLTELLSRPQSDRVVIRAGRPMAARVPDHRELDSVVGAPSRLIPPEAPYGSRSERRP
jgi:cytosine deaminase